LQNLVDILVFASFWPAGIAAALIAAVAAAFGGAPPVSALVLGFFGTFVVYNIDRLRDIDRDRTTTPARTAFIERHQSELTFASALGAIFCALAAAMLPASISFLCAFVLTAGLLHRRIKHVAGWKTAYISFAWVAVCIGIPALLSGLPTHEILPTGIVIGMTIAANLIVLNMHDQVGGITRMPNNIAMGLAFFLCAAAALACLGEMADLARGLAPIPTFEALAVAGFASDRAKQSRERYGLVVVDGALLVGAIVACLSMHARLA